MKAALIVGFALLSGVTGALAQSGHRWDSLAVERLLASQGQTEKLRRVAALRICIANFITANGPRGPSASAAVEAGFAACATEESALRNYALTLDPKNPAKALSAVSDYEAMLKSDFVRNLAGIF